MPKRGTPHPFIQLGTIKMNPINNTVVVDTSAINRKTKDENLLQLRAMYQNQLSTVASNIASYQGIKYVAKQVGKVRGKLKAYKRSLKPKRVLSESQKNYLREQLEGARIRRNYMLTHGIPFKTKKEKKKARGPMPQAVKDKLRARREQIRQARIAAGTLKPRRSRAQKRAAGELAYRQANPNFVAATPRSRTGVGIGVIGRNQPDQPEVYTGRFTQPAAIRNNPLFTRGHLPEGGVIGFRNLHQALKGTLPVYEGTSTLPLEEEADMDTTLRNNNKRRDRDQVGHTTRSTAARTRPLMGASRNTNNNNEQ